MNFVDLHTHSTASDGTLSPEEVATLASLKGLQAMALTDHDTIDGISRAKKASAACGIELIPGIELSCVLGGTEIHILGFFADETDQKLLDDLKSLRKIRDFRNEDMLNRFREDGFDITWEDLRNGVSDTVITRAHFARVLSQKGYAPSPSHAFETYLQYGGRYCIRPKDVTPGQIMELLTSHRMWPCLAHPMLYHMGYREIRDFADHLKSLGLRGLEVYHSSHSQSQSAQLQVIARELGLLPSGGSDFHGANKPDVEIGRGRGGLRVSYSLLRDIKNDYCG